MCNNEDDNEYGPQKSLITLVADFVQDIKNLEEAVYTLKQESGTWHSVKGELGAVLSRLNYLESEFKKFKGQIE